MHALPLFGIVNGIHQRHCIALTLNALPPRAVLQTALHCLHVKVSVTLRSRARSAVYS